MHFKIGELLCSHLNIEDGRKYAAFLPYYALLFKKVKTQLKCKKKICAMYEEGVLTDQTCPKLRKEAELSKESLGPRCRAVSANSAGSSELQASTLTVHSQCVFRRNTDLAGTAAGGCQLTAPLVAEDKQGLS